MRCRQELMRNTVIRLGAIALSTLLASTLSVRLPTSPAAFTSTRLTWGADAFAQRSGGRAGGGSFRSSPRSSSPSRPSSGGGSSRPSGGYSGGYSSPSRPYGGGGPVIVPVPAGPPPVYYPPGGYGGYGSPYPTTTVTSGGSWIVGLIILFLLGSVGLPMIFAFIHALTQGSRAGIQRGDQELFNDIFTVSKVQVALLAQARSIQDDLNQMAEAIDTSTETGLLQLMQESVLALLRSPENWSHALVSSETVNGFEKADSLFSTLSLQERTKYSVETLTNVGGRRSSKTFTVNPDKGPASYILITLLVGSAHDQPLFPAVHSVQELQLALQKLASMPAEYVKVFEIIWTPQDPGDVLTYDELLTQYPDMVQL